MNRFPLKPFCMVVLPFNDNPASTSGNVPTGGLHSLWADPWSAADAPVGLPGLVGSRFR